MLTYVDVDVALALHYENKGQHHLAEILLDPDNDENFLRESIGYEAVEQLKGAELREYTSTKVHNYFVTRVSFHRCDTVASYLMMM